MSPGFNAGRISQPGGLGGTGSRGNKKLGEVAGPSQPSSIAMNSYSRELQVPTSAEDSYTSDRYGAQCSVDALGVIP
jgi:hypothetical protein